MSTILQINKVNKAFGGLKALHEVNLSVESGSVHAVIGPNGAGKSTLLNCLVGKLVPDSGEVLFNGQSLLGLKSHEINQSGISRVFQTPEIFRDMTVLENAMIPALSRQDGSFRLNILQHLDRRRDALDKVHRIIAELGLSGMEKKLAGTLGRGDKRRLELAMCLAQDPKLLLLDEPTAGMSRQDTDDTIELLKDIASKDLCMIVIEHDMHVVFSLSDHISVLAQGSVICEGTPEQVKNDPRVQEAYLGGGHP